MQSRRFSVQDRHTAASIPSHRRTDAAPFAPCRVWLATMSSAFDGCSHSAFASLPLLKDHLTPGRGSPPNLSAFQTPPPWGAHRWSGTSDALVAPRCLIALAGRARRSLQRRKALGAAQPYAPDTEPPRWVVALVVIGRHSQDFSGGRSRSCLPGSAVTQQLRVADPSGADYGAPESSRAVPHLLGAATNTPHSRATDGLAGDVRHGRTAALHPVAAVLRDGLLRALAQCHIVNIFSHCTRMMHSSSVLFDDP